MLNRARFRDLSLSGNSLWSCMSTKPALGTDVRVRPAILDFSAYSDQSGFQVIWMLWAYLKLMFTRLGELYLFGSIFKQLQMLLQLYDHGPWK